MDLTFTPWPKIPRLRRDMIITEKIDGTNAAVGIVAAAEDASPLDALPGAPFEGAKWTRMAGDGPYFVYAQSRRRLITPADDNYGFARWTWDNAAYLASILGPGLHFGEWWGQGIQRGYGLDHKRFSLFNTHRWGWLNDSQAREAKAIPDQLWSVPIVAQWTFDTAIINETFVNLREKGSFASPGFMDPEGIIVYHTAAGAAFKMTFEYDEKGKGE